MKEDEELSKLVTLASVSGIAGLLLGIAKIIIHENHGNLLRFFRGAVSSIVVAVLASFALNDSGMSWARQAAIVGILAYVADDILSGLLVLGKLFANNPGSFLRDVLASIRGGKRP